MRTLCTVLVLGLLTMAVPAVSQADDAPATKITIQFENQEIVKVIRVLAQFGRANVIVSPQVKGTISINLRDVPWKAALKVVVEAAGAKLIEEDYGILRVVPGLEVGPDRAGRKAVKKKRRRLLELETARRAADLRVKGEMDSSRLLERAKAVMAAEAKVRAAKLELKDLQDKVVVRYTERLRLQPEAPVAKEKYEKLHVKVLRGTAKGSAPGLRGVVIDKDGKPIQGAGVTLGFPERPFRGGGAPPSAAGKAATDRERVAFVTGRRQAVKRSKADEAALRFAEAELLLRQDPAKRRPNVIKRMSKVDWAATSHLGAQSGAQARRRIENLQSAARHLLAAGDKEGANRVRTRAVAALKQLERQEALAKGGTPPHDLRGSLDGLRGEVRALRAEVRELTMLVRLLLQKQK